MKFLWNLLLVGNGLVWSTLIFGVLSQGVVLLRDPSRENKRGFLMMV